MARKKVDLKEKEVFTTYDAAKICNANIASIKNWIAKGLLKAFRTPGGHYRIKRRDLQLFIQKYNMPNPFEERYEKKIYLLDLDPRSLRVVQAALEGHEVVSFDDPLPAVLQIGLDRPDLLVLDLDLGDVRGEDFFDLLQGYPETRNIRVVVYTHNSDQEMAIRLRKKGVSDIVAKNVEPADLRKALEEQLES